MRCDFKREKCVTAKLTAPALCTGILAGSLCPPVCAGETSDDDFHLVDVFCSQSAKDALGEDQLSALVELITASIEPQAVNILVESFPCFTEAAENNELGREISMYIYFKEGDQDGISEHEETVSDSYAYVLGGQDYEDGISDYKYMIGMDAAAICTFDDENKAVLDINDQTRFQIDNTFCHELFHAFMEDYNRAGMTGMTDPVSYFVCPVEELTIEEGEQLIRATLFPSWFQEGLAGCVGTVYPADLDIFEMYHYDPETKEYLDICTKEQLVRFYTRSGYLEGTGKDRYDLEAAEEDNSDGHVNGSTYVSGYMACLYLADLAYRNSEGESAVVYDENGQITSISSEKLRDGISKILSDLHRGDTLDEVISDISDGSYTDTEDFTAHFIKGNYNEETEDYEGDPGSLDFCVGYLNYMYQLDSMDPETHPAGSLLQDDFRSTEPTPLTKDLPAESEVYRIVEQNTVIASTVKCGPDEMGGGTSYSGRDSFDTVVEKFKAG